MKTFIGIEIGEEYLKMIVATRKGVQLKLLDCIISPLSSNTNDEAITAIIADIIKKNKYKSKSAILAVPRNFVTMRTLHLPSKNEEELSKMIGLHINRIIPYKKEEVNFKYNLLGVDEMGYSRALLAIVNNNILRKPIMILEKAGLSVERVTLSSGGIWKWVLNNFNSQINETDLYLILAIDTTFTDFIVFNKENLLFTRSIPIKANELNAELVRSRLLGELKQSLLIFNSEEINKKPSCVFLTGALGAGLDKEIERNLNIKVICIDAPEFPGQISQTILRNVSVIALSELVLEGKDQELSFVLPEIKIRKSLRKKMWDLAWLGIILIYSLSLMFLVYAGKVNNQRIYLEKLTERSVKIEKELGELMLYLDEIKFIKKRLNVRRGPLFVVNRLQGVISDNICINLLKVDKDDRIILRGQAVQLSDVFNLVTNLEQVDHFKDVQTKYTHKRRLRDKREVIDFELNFVLTY